MRRLIAYTHSRDDPASRFRFRQYVPYLEQAGWSVSLRTPRPQQPRQSPFRNPVLRYVHQQLKLAFRRANRLRDVLSASDYDVAFLNRDLLESHLLYERLLRLRNPRFIFDFDDAIFLGGREAHFQWVCRHAARVTAGNELLAREARRFSNKVSVLPTVIEVEKYLFRPDLSPPRVFRVGWCGSDRSIRQTLFPHLGLLVRLQARFGFDLVIMSKPRPDLPENLLRWKYVEWSESRETQLASFFDAGIMPLTGDPYQQYKCGCKILQYMAAGLPAIASPVGINTKLLRNGQSGFLAGTEEEWFRAIDALMGNDSLCRKLGSAGRALAAKKYSLKRWLPVLLELLESVSRVP